jgi:hypothetical protein
VLALAMLRGCYRRIALLNCVRNSIPARGTASVMEKLVRVFATWDIPGLPVIYSIATAAIAMHRRMDSAINTPVIVSASMVSSRRDVYIRTVRTTARIRTGCAIRSQESAPAPKITSVQDAKHLISLALESTSIPSIFSP